MKKRRPAPRYVRKKLTAPKKGTPPVAADGPVPCPLITVALNGCITVDNSVDQNTYLELARERYASPPNATHDTRQAAIANAQTCLAGGKKVVNLVGHGDQGLILTGSADLDTTDATKFIGLSNIAACKVDLGAITHAMTSLTLLACDTGAGADGASLLSQLATKLNVPVEAPTGLVYLASGTSDPFLERCAQWQQAVPGVLPDPIPVPRLSHPNFLMRTLILRGADRLAITKVVSLELYKATSTDSALVQSWSGRGAQVAASYAEFDQPFEPGGVPAAIVTGMLVLTFKGATGIEQRSFRVYNHRLLQDMTYEETFYYTAIAELVGPARPMRAGTAARRSKSDAARRKRTPKPAVKGRR